MTPHDAVFFAAAAGLLLPRHRLAWLAAATPFLVVAARPLGPAAAPVVALAAVFVNPRLAPTALFLAAGAYGGLADAARAAALWLVADTILASMEPRFEEVDSRLRGAPIRLFAAGVLYYALLPVAYL